MQSKVSTKWENEFSGNISTTALASLWKIKSFKKTWKKDFWKKCSEFFCHIVERIQKEKHLKKGEQRNAVYRASNKNDNLNVDYQDIN